jgi:outer membrane protein
MNKLFNIVIAVAIAILYILHFTGNHTASPAEIKTKDSIAASKPIVQLPKSIKPSKIVYINSDVLNEKYDYVKDLTSEAQKKQSKLENEYQTKGQKLQEDVAEYQQKASQGLLSENQRATTEEGLAKRKEELDQMQNSLQILMDDIQKKNDEVRKTVIDYVKEYNKTSQYNYVLTYTEGPGGIVLLANDSLDITSEIIDGLNAQYRAKKKK